ncbi:MAG TPA: cytochrome c oxidase assembly protein [Alphaproteobacteria bacterium]|nr:cytochrome c oxidase assembly protein [Alphaproteobacteria bacterium]
MTPTWRKRLPTILGALGMIAVMTTLVCYAPTLYRLFCGATGAGGTTRRADASKIVAQDPKGPAITVYFDANVSPALGWDFRPVQRSVVVHPGVPAKIYFEATNDTSDTLVGHATYNVTPYKIAPYFFKIQCFCFTDERLGPHQTAKMPVLFYLDEQMLKDPQTSYLRQVTLSYTFFKQDKLSAGEVGAARDLKKGSAALDVSLTTNNKQAFDNDAPKRND